jgi:hypothetical protein
LPNPFSMKASLAAIRIGSDFLIGWSGIQRSNSWRRQLTFTP